MSERVRHAIILAGGKGERIRPFTDDRPKPMISLNGSGPIVDHQINQLKAAGVETIVFACSYKKEALQDYIGDGSKHGIRAIYSVEDTPLGRGGAIKKAMGLLGKGFGDVVATNGDNIWKIDIGSLVKKHGQYRPLITMVLVPFQSPYGIVETDGNDWITSFREKPVLPHKINAGVYVFSEQVKEMLPDVGDHEDDLVPSLAKKRQVLSYLHQGYWRAIDTVKDLKEAEKEVAKVFGK